MERERRVLTSGRERGVDERVDCAERGRKRRLRQQVAKVRCECCDWQSEEERRRINGRRDGASAIIA